jgi:hypothetical protein
MLEMQDNIFLRPTMLSGFCITGGSCDASEKCIRSYFLDRGEMVTKIYEIFYAPLSSSGGSLKAIAYYACRLRVERFMAGEL